MVAIGSIILAALFAAATISTSEGKVFSENELEEYLRGDYEIQSTIDCSKENKVTWDKEAHIGNVDYEEKYMKAMLENAKHEKLVWEEYFRDSRWHNFTNLRTKRQMMFLTELGTSALDDVSQSEYIKHKSAMLATFSSAKICPYKKQQCNLKSEGLNLDPDVFHILETSDDYDELAYVWTAWRNQTGPAVKPHFKKYVNISNLAAQLNGYNDMGEMWRSNYDTPTFIEDMDELWDQVKPLYNQLYTYVKRKLEIKFRNKLSVEEDGLLPAHIFGNMWAQTWTNLFDLVCPFPDVTPSNVTEALIKKNFTVLEMFETANDFFKSLGMPNSSMSYDVRKGAIISKPIDRKIVCHPSAWDFCDGKDYRIKMCTRVRDEDFVVIHHEMGHIQYFILYKDQPITFRSGANNGFHEAIGDTIGLSVLTRSYLYKLGLVENDKDTEEDRINELMSKALERVALLPFSLLIDKWRWDVFSGKVNESSWNAHWWELRETIQQVKAPVTRTESDFDPASKFHINSDDQYISYFVAIILQFQLHKALCIEAGQYDPTADLATRRPLHTCNIYGSLDAGRKLMKGLSLGSSEHWREVLYKMTGDRKLDASALLEYFQPLSEYLEQENTKETLGFEKILVFVGSVLAIVCLIILIVYLILLVRKTKNNKHTLNVSNVFSPGPI